MFPLHAMSKKQGSVAYCTPEAEIVAANLALRQEGLPAVELWSTLFREFYGLTIPCEFLEDNQACIRVMESGKNPTLRYLGRTHKVDMGMSRQ